MTSSVTKATPIKFIDGKCHIKKQKGHKTPLRMPFTLLVINALTGGHADTHASTHTDA